MKFQVVETFVSLQGESTHAGKLCFFIRLAGCNLNCSYCDTKYALTHDCGQERTLEELLGEAANCGAHTVELTGGEPLLDPNTPYLAAELLKLGLEVLIETNGSLPVEVLPPGVKRIVDCKLPNSGMSDRNLWHNFEILNCDDEVKFVISNREDYDYACKVIKRYFASPENRPELLMSAVFGRIELATLAGWIIEDCLPVRMQLQMHKFIWDPNRTGV